jgi:hypothetical protein
MNIVKWLEIEKKKETAVSLENYSEHLKKIFCEVCGAASVLLWRVTIFHF